MTMAKTVSCVVVLYQPADAVLALVDTFVAGGYDIVVVVNEASPAIRQRLNAGDSVSVIDNHGNIGLAKALNVGIQHAFAVNHSDYVALFDQDSMPDADLPRLLADELKLAEVARVACIGPQLIDRKNSVAQYHTNCVSALDHPRSIPTSGTVISRTAYGAVGPMMEELFIDGIDHEWCLRAWSKGYSVCVSPNVAMLHDMGDASMNYFGRYKPVHRSPLRHYYVVRNTFYLMRFTYLPLSWRLSELLKTPRRMAAYVVFSSDRWRTLRLIAHAVRDGIAGRMGACTCA